MSIGRASVGEAHHVYIVKCANQSYYVERAAQAVPIIWKIDWKDIKKAR